MESKGEKWFIGAVKVDSGYFKKAKLIQSEAINGRVPEHKLTLRYNK